MSRKNWTSDKLFQRLLENKTQRTYWENISELRKRVGQNVYDRSTLLARSNNDNEKVIGIDVLAQLGFDPRLNKSQTVQLYFELLENHQSPKVLYSILHAIGHNNEDLKRTQISKLVEFKNHRYSSVRYSLVHALSGVESELAIETLIELSGDKNTDIRDWATFAIGSQIEINSSEIIHALWDRINDEDEKTRHEAIAGLSKRKDSRVKEILKKELENVDENGSLVLESIEDYGDKDFIPLLEQQIETNKRTNRVNEKWLLDSLETLKTNSQQTL